MTLRGTRVRPRRPLGSAPGECSCRGSSAPAETSARVGAARIRSIGLGPRRPRGSARVGAARIMIHGRTSKNVGPV